MDYYDPTDYVGDDVVYTGEYYEDDYYFDTDVDLHPKLISLVTVFSLLAVLTLVFTSYGLSRGLLPTTASLKIRLLFIWHIFDALVHFTLEGSFLYYCFTAWAPIPHRDDLPYVQYFPMPMTPQGVNFLAQSNRLYGPFYSQEPLARLWQEYARADRRWGGSDLTIISLELLTVFVMAPLSIYICHLLRRGDPKAWVVMIIVATGELYGGFMTFAPEWLTGNPNLDSSNWMFLWLYLVFFNAGLWVVIPLWVLYESCGAILAAFSSTEKKTKPSKVTVPGEAAGKKEQ